MHHALAHVLIHFVFYLAFYWIGFALTNGLSFGRAVIMPYGERGQDEDAAWWEFRLRRLGYTEWRAETMIIVGGLAFLAGVSGYYVCRYLL